MEKEKPQEDPLPPEKEVTRPPLYIPSDEDQEDAGSTKFQIKTAGKAYDELIAGGRIRMYDAAIPVAAARSNSRVKGDGGTTWRRGEGEGFSGEKNGDNQKEREKERDTDEQGAKRRGAPVWAWEAEAVKAYDGKYANDLQEEEIVAASKQEAKQLPPEQQDELQEVAYFKQPPLTERVRIATVIACYNEERGELERTLVSLARQQQLEKPLFSSNSKQTLYENHIVVVFDGIEKMHDSMKVLAVEFFPDLHQLLYTDSEVLLSKIKAAEKKKKRKQEQNSAENDLTKVMAEMCDLMKMQQGLVARDSSNASPDEGEPEADVPRHPTFIVQNLVGGEIQPFTILLPKQRAIEKAVELKLNLSFILKLDNRQKHNTHEWGFLAFSRDIKAEYVFASDVGTLYSKHCIYRLADYLRQNKDVSACTGRQRVMTATQQGSEESLFSLARWYRYAQCYDYESSFASFMSAFHLAGMLPVIPGPCGMSRYDDMAGEGEPWEWYFQVVHTPPEKQDIVLGNLLLAEDRVLCYGAALKTKERRYTALVPQSTFYFAAETDLKTFSAQRRRWINGTVAGYIYLALYHPGLIFKSKHFFPLKVMMWLLMMCQLRMFAVVALSPGLFLISLRLSLEVIWPMVRAASSVYTDIIWGIAVVSYLAFVIRHRSEKFDAFLFYWMMFLNAVTMILSVTTTALAVVEADRPDFLDPTDKPALTYEIAMVVGISTLFPPFISLFTGGGSVIWMLTTIVPFYLFLPTLVSTFGAYAFARTFDLSWGNRPASEIERDAERLVGQAREDAKAKLSEQSQASCGFIVMLNVLLVLVALMSLNVAVFMLCLGAAVFLFSAVQMVVSFFWFTQFFCRWLLASTARFLKHSFSCLCQRDGYQRIQ